MSYKVSLTGDGSLSDPFKPDLLSWDTFQRNSDGTATVTLTIDMALRVRNFAATAAGELNSGTPWGNMTAIKPERLSLTLVKQDLVDNVKLTYNQVMNLEGGITAGGVVAHDNGSVKGMWRADVDTSAEPTKDSPDWSLVFEITV